MVPQLGVVIVTFNAADVICDCLDSLLASQGVQLCIAVVDNASTDGTAAQLRRWAADRAIPDLPARLAPGAPPDPGHALAVLDAGANGGFAAGVNLGLARLAALAALDRFWILNPDAVAAPDAARAFACEPGPSGGFALMGGRVIYLDHPDRIQIDGGVIDWRTGVTGNVHQYQPLTTPPPDPARFDFITGASMVASRAFYEKAGPLPEDYFLYYEEVDWAQRRGGLPLAYCPQAVVYHRAGTAIGSPRIGRPASAFSLYFKHRARMRFVRRHRPLALPLAAAYSLAKAGQLVLQGYPAEGWTIVAASFGLPPPADIRARLGPAASRRAFG